ncbi:hypothetical protein DUT90_01700 [Polaribacter sp. WD7]|uniref:DUF6624 domain-containing protein n=1 Tax=Polaribacter sp. WD7 TaxID=2269061 RepID=UPI000DF4652D|nr:DUF6624 domain-containing protein [Polaribacter sp. WD7]RCS28046.1 hypothetical protein DUT90_01700 [Polaribacter sp. WD7]
MKKLIRILIISLPLFGCKEKLPEKKKIQEKVEFNQNLADELKIMAKVDQIAAYIPQGKYKKMTSEQWDSFKDSVFTTHQKRLEEIFVKYGFVGFDLAGEEGSRNFWLMVQHSDHNPDFQKEVLEKMKIQVEKQNAEASIYGLLVDRVNINTGKPQIYGTQVDYNFDLAQAFPKNLTDSVNVNERRKTIGLKPIEEYLNQMTLMNFEMNKKFYAEKGITEPKLYKTE